MQITATYDDGKIKLPSHIQLRHSTFKVDVIIPDEEIEVVDTQEIAIDYLKSLVNPEVIEAAAVSRAKLDVIRLAPLPENDQDDNEVSEEYLERLNAFALRDK